MNYLLQALEAIVLQQDWDHVNKVKKTFMDCLAWGGFFIPILLATVDLFKSVMPSLKKKKGKLPESVSKLEKELWTPLKTQIKRLAAEFD